MFKPNRTIVAYAAAVLGPPLLAWLCVQTFPVLLDKAVFLPFFFVVLGVAYLRGMGPGLLAALWGAVVCAALLPPHWRLHLENRDQQLILALYLGLAFCMCWVCDSLRAKGVQAQQEETLRERALDAARYQTALLAGRMGSWETDFVAGTRIWSAPGMALFGLDLPDGRGKVGGPHDEWVAAVHPEDRHLLPGIVAQGETQDSFPVEYRIRRPDGEVAWLAGRGQVIDRQANGKPARYINVMADVSELRNAAEALKTADRRKDEFLAVLAHELRNPIAPISNALQIMRLAAGENPTLSAPQRIIERQLGQMVRLVDDLLDVNRITQGKLMLRPRPVALRGIVESAVEACQPLLDARGHHLGLRLPEEEVRLCADPARLAQVLANLLGNAAKYTDDGGRIALEVALNPGGAGAVNEGGTGGGTEGDDEVVIVVSDNGIGIPPDRLADIFTMFTQIESAREGTRSGLGIGLTLVKELVELHGGSVTAHSAGPGQGSRFTVRLPVGTLGAAAEPGGAAPVRAAGAARRILVVDDNSDSADSLATILRMMGHACAVAYDGPEALAAAEGFEPELVFLDIGLPSISGFEVAQRLRERPWARGIVLVALTGWGQADDRRRSGAAGFDQHLVKPVEFADVDRILAGMDDPQAARV